MALGGGTYTTQNKILPGTYVNYKTVPTQAILIAERGTVAMLAVMDWGDSGTVREVTAEEFQTNSLNAVGYAYDHANCLMYREVFKHAKTAIVYNVADSTGAKATCTLESNQLATAKYDGKRGNDLKLVVQANVDDASMYDVSLYLGTAKVFEQSVSTWSELAENNFVTWGADVSTVPITAGVAFTGGKTGYDNQTVSVDLIQNALNVFESYQFDVLCCPSFASSTMFVEYTKRMRETTNRRFQTVISEDIGADYEGVVQLVTGQNANAWVAGALAGARGNTSCTNMKYDGELTINTAYTQRELEQLIKTGVFAFHKENDEVRVLTDINSFVSYTEDKGPDLSKNQVIRGLDTHVLSVIRLHHDRFIGKIPADDPGRVSLWDGIVALSKEEVANRTLENYDSSTLVVKAGNDKVSTVVTDVLDFVCAMEKLYLDITLN